MVCEMSPGSNTRLGFLLIAGDTTLPCAQRPVPQLFQFISAPFTSVSLFSLSLSPAIHLPASLVHCVLSDLNTFEKEGLPSYLGHGIKVTGASVRGVSHQSERGGRR